MVITLKPRGTVILFDCKSSMVITLTHAQSLFENKCEKKVLLLSQFCVLKILTLTVSGDSVEYYVPMASTFILRGCRNQKIKQKFIEAFRLDFFTIILCLPLFSLQSFIKKKRTTIANLSE